MSAARARSNGDAFERDGLAAQAIVRTVDATHSAGSKQIEHFIALPDWSKINCHGHVLRLSVYQGIIIGRCYVLINYIDCITVWC